ncbi:phage holin, LLH family [Clostridium pasteurianum]|uniref:Phage holin, LL-H family n=1 Tax=Clostridium pasteurianum BC1 TaxID=86416 RepID=R4KA85_CLOPA|nr:phage holin, LLH family [Clostridium pasteurianum]AGK96525.1 hypothetical protein Clopa_1599 [Clostridium pasteurianum BC1]
MKEIIISQILIPILGAIISTFIGIITYYARQLYNKHKGFLQLQQQELIQKIGIDKYNIDVVIIKNAVKAVEQLGKENDWTGTFKHSKVLELIADKTGLTDEQIYNIIKGAVLEVNSLKNSSGTISAQK